MAQNTNTDDTKNPGMQDTPEQGEKGGQPTREEYGEEDTMPDMDSDY